MRIVFLDVDGVVAPRINAGQIVHRCMEGVVRLCQLTGARIVLSSSWRVLTGKTECVAREDARASTMSSDCRLPRVHAT